MGVNIKDIQFYEETGLVGSRKINVNVVTSRLMELYVFFGILTYLIILYFGLQKVSGRHEGDVPKDERVK